MRRLRGPWLSPGEQIFSIEHRSYPGLDNLLIVFKCGEDYNEHETDAELLTQKKKKNCECKTLLDIKLVYCEICDID